MKYIDIDEDKGDLVYYALTKDSVVVLDHAWKQIRHLVRLPCHGLFKKIMLRFNKKELMLLSDYGDVYVVNITNPRLVLLAKARTTMWGDSQAYVEI